MKAVILAGGLGTRISEETSLRPKPMVEIGGHPVLWHILKMYSQHGIFDFVICLGYKGYVIKEYFANYFLHTADVTFHMPENRMEVHGNTTEPWRITLVDTGDGTGTGGRIKKIAPHIQNEEIFCLTYGDGVSDVDITSSIAFHREHGKLATPPVVHPSARFGLFGIEATRVQPSKKNQKGEGGGITGVFFFLPPRVFDYMGDAPAPPWER